ncbi:LLM class flavin-dependent oxidoreductase [Sphingobium sp. AN558]|uniref:LLM class flavin-dependent oxidoreductase n=1 Tax=Sphingobium sp. AN558 TaxID=3133442 RepID=UPI0030BC6B4D
MRTEQMILGWLMNPSGSHRAGWMKFLDKPDPLTDISVWTELAREAERAKLDFIFHADWPSVRPGAHAMIARNTSYNNHLEPLTVMSALSSVTSGIGLVATGSTSHNEPYNLARQFAALDHVSHGRAGWNIVTSRSPIAALNYGHEREIPHAERYRRGEEFVDVVMKLWDSYEDDAFVRDTESGYYFDPKKLHVQDHVGEYYRVRGPLNIARPPQGYPVRFQAGASDVGRQLGARVADVLFCTYGDLDVMLDYYRETKNLTSTFGRRPGDVKVCCGFEPIVAQSEAEAEDKLEELNALLHPDTIREVVSNDIEADISHLQLDDYVTVADLPRDANSSKSADKLLRSWLNERSMTVREIFSKFSSARSALSVHGTPQQIADKMEEWFTAGAVDGFMLIFTLPTGMRDFGRLVVPELQRRGLFKTEYAGKTLRENLGLRRPAFGEFEPQRDSVTGIKV